MTVQHTTPTVILETIETLLANAEKHEKNTSSTATIQYQNNTLVDIHVLRNGKSLYMLGGAGSSRECSCLSTFENFVNAVEGTYDSSLQLPLKQQTKLPVFIGSGAGFALKLLLVYMEKLYGNNFALAVVDKEVDILSAAKTQNQFSDYPQITWITSQSVKKTLQQLTIWQEKHNNLPLIPYVHPFYLRLDREFYAAIRDTCNASAKANFWAKARYKKFAQETPRILLLTSKYFLMGEIIAACERMHIEYFLLQLPEGEVGQADFIKELLTAVTSFMPDFIFTLNHLGVDKEGVLIELLEKLELPLASWFVDNPHLVLHLYANLVNPWTTIFTWDHDNIDSLSAMGFQHVLYMPLGTDHYRFVPLTGSKNCASNKWQSRVSFVGNSMVTKVTKHLERGHLSRPLVESYKDVAFRFSQSHERSVMAFLQSHYPDLKPYYDSLATMEDKLSYETMLTWEATRQYRFKCVTATLPFSPLIVGDKGWHELLPDSGWNYHAELNYYSDLPVFYPHSDINFNCTSKQMKGAVNQRVFDVPATESFLLTDYREQIENLFEPGKEVICYQSPEEATALIEQYLEDPAARKKIAVAARKRILAEHTYEHRLTHLIAHMKHIYG